jgi:hypothetical protein
MRRTQLARNWKKPVKKCKTPLTSNDVSASAPMILNHRRAFLLTGQILDHPGSTYYKYLIRICDEERWFLHQKF